jgi:hypothetical protein
LPASYVLTAATDHMHRLHHAFYGLELVIKTLFDLEVKETVQQNRHNTPLEILLANYY